MATDALSYYLNRPNALGVSGTKPPFSNILTDFLSQTPAGDAVAGAAGSPGPDPNVGQPRKSSEVPTMANLQAALAEVDKLFQADESVGLRRFQLAMNPGFAEQRIRDRINLKTAIVNAHAQLMQESRLAGQPGPFEEELAKLSAQMVAEQAQRQDLIRRASDYISQNPDLPDILKKSLMAYATVGIQLSASAAGESNDVLKRMEIGARLGENGVTKIPGFPELEPVAQQAYAQANKPKPKAEEPLDPVGIFGKVTNIAKDFQELSKQPAEVSRVVEDEYGQAKTTKTIELRPTLSSDEAMKKAAESVVAQDPRTRPLLEKFLNPVGEQKGFDPIEAARKRLREKASAGAAAPAPE